MDEPTWPTPPPYRPAHALARRIAARASSVADPKRADVRLRDFSRPPAKDPPE